MSNSASSGCPGAWLQRPLSGQNRPGASIARLRDLLPSAPLGLVIPVDFLLAHLHGVYEMTQLIKRDQSSDREFLA